jgi:hypothetical protein
MLIKLTEEQLQWVLKGTHFSDKVINMYRDHFVNSIAKMDAAKRHGLSLQFATKKWARFENLIVEKCEKNGLEIATILHAIEDKNAVYSFDISNTQKQKEK